MSSALPNVDIPRQMVDYKYALIMPKNFLLDSRFGGIKQIKTRFISIMHDVVVQNTIKLIQDEREFAFSFQTFKVFCRPV